MSKVMNQPTPMKTTSKQTNKNRVSNGIFSKNICQKKNIYIKNVDRRATVGSA